MKKINFLIVVIFLLTSCGSLDEASKVLKNEKIKTTDEFLVKKRDPLVLPPDYKEIPLPGSAKNLKKKDNSEIKKILKATKEEKISNEKVSSTENSIIEKIRK